MGRKTKYTPETRAKIMQAIQLGATYELAAHYAGISEALFYRWMNQKVEFVESVQKASGTAAMVWLAKIEQAATDGEWTAAAWKLERRYPKMYGRTVQQVEHSGSIDISSLAAQRKAALRAGIAPDAMERWADELAGEVVPHG